MTVKYISDGETLWQFSSQLGVPAIGEKIRVHQDRSIVIATGFLFSSDKQLISVEIFLSRRYLHEVK